MKNFPGLTSSKSSRRITLLCMVICCVSLIAAFIVGISGNLPGLALCYVAAISIVLAFVHKCRKIKKFLILSGTSVIGFFVFVVLHNLLYALAELTSDIIVLNYLLEFLHAVCFLIALMLCPAAFLVGAAGSIFSTIAYFKKKRIRNKDA